jgi:hypothetical protein
MQFTELTSLIFTTNGLLGSIPDGLAKLTKLKNLALNNNALTGTIPVQLAQLTMLTGLHLTFSGLRGTIPNEFALLTRLTDLGLSWNQLTGPIPEGLGKLTRLAYLGLGHCQFVGTIPSQLSFLRVLTSLHLSGNRLTGHVPSLPFTQYTDNCDLQVVNSPTNNYTCPLPLDSEFCKGGPPTCTGPTPQPTPVPTPHPETYCTGDSILLPKAQCDAWIELYEAANGSVACSSLDRTDPCSMLNSPGQETCSANGMTMTNM